MAMLSSTFSEIVTRLSILVPCIGSADANAALVPTLPVAPGHDDENVGSPDVVIPAGTPMANCSDV